MPPSSDCDLDLLGSFHSEVPVLPVPPTARQLHYQSVKFCLELKPAGLTIHIRFNLRLQCHALVNCNSSFYVWLRWSMIYCCPTSFEGAQKRRTSSGPTMREEWRSRSVCGTHLLRQDAQLLCVRFEWKKQYLQSQPTLASFSSVVICSWTLHI